MSNIDSIHDWTEDDVSRHGEVVAALVRHGVDSDLIDVTPEGIWYVANQVAMGFSDGREDFDASDLEEGGLVATGDLETVAAAVAEFVAPPYRVSANR